MSAIPGATNYLLTSGAVTKVADVCRRVLRDKPNLTGDKSSPRPGSPRYFWAILQNPGPDSEADYTDNRYWFKAQVISNDSDDDTDAATFEDATGDFALIGTATNLGETSSTHNLAMGSNVQVWWEFDQSDPTLIRCIISVAALPAGSGKYKVLQLIDDLSPGTPGWDWPRFH